MFALYLYLAENAPEYPLWGSPTDVEAKLGISESSYHRAMKTLEKDGYLVKQFGSTYFFYTNLDYQDEEVEEEIEPVYSPMTTECSQPWIHPVVTDDYSTYSPVTTEISNISNVYLSISREQNEESKREKRQKKSFEKWRELNQFSKEELQEMLEDFQAHMKYQELQSKYKIDWKHVNSNLGKEIEAILGRIQQDEWIDRLAESELFDCLNYEGAEFKPSTRKTTERTMCLW